MTSSFSGPIFTIFVGLERKPLYTHAAVLLKLETLHVLVEGEWKDSPDRQINLEEWDKETVEKLLEWLHTGEYSYPLPEPITNKTTSSKDVESKCPTRIVTSSMGAHPLGLASSSPCADPFPVWYFVNRSEPIRALTLSHVKGIGRALQSRQRSDSSSSHSRQSSHANFKSRAPSTPTTSPSQTGARRKWLQDNLSSTARISWRARKGLRPLKHSALFSR